MDLYQLLLRLSDQPRWPSLRGQAKHLLQLLPTCPGLAAALKAALLQVGIMGDDGLWSEARPACSNMDMDWQ